MHKFTLHFKFLLHIFCATSVFLRLHVYCSHPFGGLVFFLSPGDKGSPLTVDVHGVIQAPAFDMRKENCLQVWKYTRDASGLSQLLISASTDNKTFLN